MTQVVLTWYEVAMASEMGRLRQVVSIAKGLPDSHGFQGAGWNEHIEGACAELSVAKALGIYWNGSVNNFGGPDLIHPIKGNIQVRLAGNHGHLIVRPGDSITDIWVLVTGKAPNYVIHGWILGANAKKPEYLKDWSGRPPAYFVPPSSLSPLDSLKESVPVSQSEIP